MRAKKHDELRSGQLWLFNSGNITNVNLVIDVDEQFATFIVYPQSGSSTARLGQWSERTMICVINTWIYAGSFTLLEDCP